MTTHTVAWQRRSPTWAKAVAVAGLLFLLLPAGYAAWLVVDDLSYRGDKFDGLGAGLGAMVLALTLVPAIPLAIFLRRGGRIAFAIGAALAATGLVSVVMMGFSLIS
ncbi:hypothetical protein LKO27_10105 [Tessaracoccus sp. OS52]|uniref:hypothetical protein n=1 Tax=Tessaracoccus sp. OS52 TaxID=2886691 RepID=UPI001D113D34|nr:hypothetical protein [Tessaracoccus sp. OS52]MCC2593757.1 hypothetical protein [Tessaracoccus sp. OS52]